MTETEQKALALVNEVAADDAPWTLDDVKGGVVWKALCRAIEQHEAFKRQVSDAVEDLLEWPSIRSQAIIVSYLSPFDLPKPVDPLVEAVGDALEAQGMGRPTHTTPELTAQLRAALAKRGGRIVWENEP